MPDLADALNRLMRARGLAAFADLDVATMVGNGVWALLSRAFADRGATADGSALTEFLADYGTHAAVKTRPYPGVVKGLHRLVAAGWRLAVCTNKPEQPARNMLEALGLDGLFFAVGGGDSFPIRKPDPGHLLATLAKAGGTPGRAVMVGDHANDVAASIACGIPCIFAAWGYGPPDMGEGATAVAGEFADVPAIAEGLLN